MGEEGIQKSNITLSIFQIVTSVHAFALLSTIVLTCRLK